MNPGIEEPGKLILSIMSNPVAALGMFVTLSVAGKLVHRSAFIPNQKMPKQDIFESFMIGSVLLLEASMVMFTGAIVRILSELYAWSTVCVSLTLVLAVGYFIMCSWEYRCWYANRSEKPDFVSKQGGQAVIVPDIIGGLSVIASVWLVTRG